MAKTMKALQILGPGEVRIVSVPVPQPGEREVLVKVRAVTVCTHWDLTLLAGTDIFGRPGYPKYPIHVGYPGHEMAGDVVAAGPAASAFRTGDRVAVWTSRATGVQGYYAEYAAVPEECLLRIPDHLSYPEAAPLELAMSVACSVRQMGDVAGKRVALGGAGAAGLIALQMIRVLGARQITVFDPVETRRALAVDLGADRALDPDSPESRALPATMAELAVECAGSAASAENLMRVTTGTVHLFGVVHGEIRYNVDHWGRGVTVAGYPGHSRESGDFALAMMRSGALRTAPLVGKTVTFGSYLEGIDALKAAVVPKVCVVPDPE